MTKEQLREYRSIKIEICQIERRIAELEQLGHGPAGELLQPLKELYRDKLVDLIRGQLEIERTLECLNPTEREVIRLRYIDGAEWIDVAEAINYEWAQTHRVHARALAKIKNL